MPTSSYASMPTSSLAGRRPPPQPRSERPTSPTSGSSGFNSGEESWTAPMLSKRRNSSSKRDLAAAGDYGPYHHINRDAAKPQRAAPYSMVSSLPSSSNSSKDQGLVQHSSLLMDANSPAEADDYLHDPDPKHHDRAILWSTRGLANALALFVIVAGLLTLFAGYPIISYFAKQAESNKGGFNIGGTNGTGQVPNTPALLRLVDQDTPSRSRTWTNAAGVKHNLVFSDEFETPGRTFYPGDDPFWEAVDIWYGATGNLEWYTPQQVNTTGGHLQITMEERPTHNLNFRAGMLQSWNKFCFQGGYIEFSALLPGTEDQSGWWPGLWVMGNLARPGYLGTTDGMWPYSYSSCDYGILPNQSADGLPAEVISHRQYGKTGLNWLRGMKASACTCAGEDHPGPNNNVGRAAPEIDVLEAQAKGGLGEASQSLQVAPFDAAYEWDDSLATVYDRDITKVNDYKGGVYQEAVSSLSHIPSDGYVDAPNPRFVTYGMEYTPDFKGDGTAGEVILYLDGKRTFRVGAESVAARPDIGIGQRLIPLEPMSIIVNFGISPGFQAIDFPSLTFPAKMLVDYVRVYQREGEERTSCDPPDHPTAAYIERHYDVFSNANYTTWPKKFPRHSFRQSC